jgi:capsid assembly protease
MLSEFLHRPWAIRREIASVVAGRIIGNISAEEARSRLVAASSQTASIVGGSTIAVIPLRGLITPNPSLLSLLFGGGGGGLQKFREELGEAVNDGEVASIVIDVDSPGGLTDLIPETAADIREAAAAKPVIAIANTEAASAAYWLASQATELVVTPSGQVGSIGVFAMHHDFSKMDEIAGVKTTLISAGKYKTEGNSYEPLSPEAQAAVQGTVDHYYGLFIADVAQGRGTTPKAVQDGFGQGRMVTPDEAVSLGMADRVATIEDVLDGLGAAPVDAPDDAVVDDDDEPVDDDIDDPQARGTVTPDEARTAAGLPPATQAGAIPPHNTPVTEEPWDKATEEKKLASPITGKTAKAMYAWCDSSANDPDGDGWPDAKSAYKFPHHMVDDDGKPQAANLNAVRSALSSLSQSTIPEADHKAVRDHLEGHLNAPRGGAHDDEPDMTAEQRRRLADVLVG